MKMRASCVERGLPSVLPPSRHPFRSQKISLTASNFYLTIPQVHDTSIMGGASGKVKATPYLFKLTFFLKELGKVIFFLLKLSDMAKLQGQGGIPYIYVR